MDKIPSYYGCSPMDTQIFNQGLSVTGTSLYILITSLMADGLKPDLSAINARWNESPEALNQALTELRALNIIERHPGPDANSEPIYIANPASLWGVAEER